MNTERIKALADSLRAAIYPDRCPLCDAAIVHNSEICPDCRKNAAFIYGERCFLCGHPADKCVCKKHKNFYEAITGPFMYTGVVKNGLAVWKFRGGLINTEFFAKLVAACVRRDFAGAELDCICFVPQTKMESDEREYNQSEELAKAVGDMLGIPVVPALKKIFETERQHKLPKFLRSGNVFGVFDCREPELTENKNILLIDDIKTSGTTLNECAKMLRLNGAIKVYCAVIAIA